MRKILTSIAAATLLFGISLSAAAAPGWLATGLTVMPENAPKVVAALDALFDSKVGRKLPGRVILRANLADGNNPETHAIVSLFRSAAESEAYRAELWADPAWGEFSSRRFVGFPSEKDPYARLSPHSVPEALLVLTRVRPR